MAEAVGLAVGVLALVGTFKDCVDLFDYFSTSRTLGRDFELLETKLDIEKTLLLQWADRVQLLDPDFYDARLRDPSTADPVSRVLCNLRLLLCEGGTLQKRYGVKSAKQSEPSKALSTVSRGRMESFTSKIAPWSEKLTHQQNQQASVTRHVFEQKLVYGFERLILRIKRRQKDVTLLNKTRWVIHDKDKFDRLIQQISYYIAKLNELVPDIHDRIPVMTRYDLEHVVDAPQPASSRRVGGMAQLMLVLEATKGQEDQVAYMTEEVITERCTRRVLECLWYRKIDDRRAHIKKAHFRTLNWALEPPSEQAANWDNLSEWLAHGTGIYWVSGKAGSGKSTLMKHLWHMDRTHDLLQEWAAPHQFIPSNFFFWHLGTSEQKSIDFLCRGLLYYIVETDPSLIPLLLPNMWREARHSDGKLTVPSLAEMTQALQKLGSAELINRRFCIFVDGLDEFEGNYVDAVAFLDTLVTNSSVKLILSSRPIPVCVDALSHRPKLRLQDLTKDDIAAYVDDVIGRNPRIQALMKSDAVNMDAVRKGLIEKSSGVFLWVVLACRSVLEGFAAYDSASELHSRVDELPPELEDLFQHMLHAIAPRYRESAAKLLRICYHNTSSDNPPIYTLILAMMDSYKLDLSRVPDSQDLHSLSQTEKLQKCKDLEGRLRSRCCGLLEVDCTRRLESCCFCLPNPHHDELIDSTITFIHRSVFEFLSTPGILNLPYLKVEDKYFAPHRVLVGLNMHLADVILSSDLNAVVEVKECVKTAIIHVHGERDNDIMFIWQFLAKFNPVWAFLFPEQKYDTQYCHNTTIKRNKPTDIVPLLALELGYIMAASALFNFNPNKGLIWHSYLLSQVLMRPISADLHLFPPAGTTLEVVKSLLRQKADPNEQIVVAKLKSSASPPWNKYHFSKASPWLIWVFFLSSCVANASPNALSITQAFIENKADIAAAEAELGAPLESFIMEEIELPNDSRRGATREQARVLAKDITYWRDIGSAASGSHLGSAAYPKFILEDHNNRIN